MQVVFFGLCLVVLLVIFFGPFEMTMEEDDV